MRFLLLAFLLTGWVWSRAMAQPSDACTVSPTTLCLGGGRFAVSVTYRDAAENAQSPGTSATSGAGQAKLLNESSGGFWFFDPDNLDIYVLVAEGCAFNERFWVLAAPNTNVEFELTVSDLSSEVSRVYSNPLGNPAAPITDTEAFATCPRKAPAAIDSTPAPEGACTPDSTTLCLLDNRFEIRLKLDGEIVPGDRIANGTAAFPFSDPSFPELFVNVVDGRAVNGNYWVFYAMFEPADFSLSVLDTATDASNTFVNFSDSPLTFVDQQSLPGDPFLAIDGTMSGAWFAPERDGEGFIFDVALVGGVPTLVLYYFTFADDGSGNQAWLVGSAPIIGSSASVPVIIANGGQFGTAFDPEAVARTAWGHVKVTFIDCQFAIIESASTIFGDDVSFVVTRLTPAAVGVAGNCADASTRSDSARKGFLPDGGYQGSWFNTTRSGEGFILNIARIDGVDTLVAFYFTFENNDSGRQAWLVGSAPITGPTVDVPMIIAAGANFGAAFDPTAVERTVWGNIRFTFESCGSVTAEAVSESFGNVTVQLGRLVPPTIGSTGDCAGP